jgi:hypothetical protein
MPFWKTSGTISESRLSELREETQARKWIVGSLKLLGTPQVENFLRRSVSLHSRRGRCFSVNNELTSVVLQRYFACMQFASANSCCCRGDILAGRAGRAREQLI